MVRAFYSLAAISITLNSSLISAQTSAPASSMNPDISLSVLSDYKHSKRSGSKAEGGFSLSEAELQFSSNIDPYLRGVALFSVHPSEAHADTDTPAAEPAEKAYAIEPEEVYLETLALPYVTLKAGRFHTALGRHNSLHTHAYPFLDAPLIHQRLLGEEGLTESGLSAALLAPVPWFSEVTVQAVQGDSPTLFSSESMTDAAEIYRWRNLFELSDESTLDVGLSGAQGANFYQGRSTVQGADLSWKWRPTTGGKYTAVILAAEYLQGKVEGRTTETELKGYATWLQYQFAERWWIQARTEKAENPQEAGLKQTKESALIAFFPSEFSGLRLQYDVLHEKEQKDQQTLWLQAQFIIGAHPAHAY